ncbi:hypothetical protein D3C81_1513610 [compost metagenome]
MVVGREQAKLGIQRLDIPVQGKTPLASIACILVGPPRHAHALICQRHAHGRQRLGNPRVGDHLPTDIQALAALGHEVVAGEEGRTVVQPGLLPVQLIEGVE